MVYLLYLCIWNENWKITDREGELVGNVSGIEKENKTG